MGDNRVRVVSLRRSVPSVLTIAVGVCVMTSCVAAVGYAQRVATSLSERVLGAQRVTVNVENASLMQVLQSIANQAGLIPFFSKTLIPNASRVTLHVNDVTVTDAFQQALRGTGLIATIYPKGDVAIVPTTDQAVAEGTITGTITDATTHRPVAGATISLDGGTKGVASSEAGTYRLAGLSAGSHTVAVKYLGYSRQVRRVIVTDGASVTVDVMLTLSANTLDLVVVTGTIIPTELKTIPNAITVITAKQLEQRGITRIDQLFRGDVPGLFALNGGSGNALDVTYMFSRGATSLGTSAYSSNPIKTYVDGVELVDASYLNQIDPRSIERIEILTGPQASTIYGSNAINGVMQIFTKRGSGMHTQLTANIISGLVQNNLSDALAPTHTADARVAGTEGRWSYNVGGAVDYMGPWNPSKQTTHYSGNSGVRMDLGRVVTDVSARRALTRNLERGFADPGYSGRFFTGAWRTAFQLQDDLNRTSTVNGQTFGIGVTYTPSSWWSHEMVLGSDVSQYEALKHNIGYRLPSDTTLAFDQSSSSRTSERYATTVRLPVLASNWLTVATGVDHWRTSAISLSATPLSSTGTLANPRVTRDRPGKNSGGFVQGQLAIRDVLFITYGLRAEWNPNYGDNANPNLAPRYGVAYTKELGALTTKLRASYGRSTRPPEEGLKSAIPQTEVTGLGQELIARYGPFDSQLANPDMLPSVQQGVEGSIDLYFGNRGSLVITRYNQTVDDLIGYVGTADSVRSLQPGGVAPGVVSSCVVASDGYCYTPQSMYLNIGSIRNQGWEAQGSLNAGPFTTRGTYTWTKSRVLGITPKYRALLTDAAYQPGRPFDNLPEHTWAVNIGYARALTNVSVTLHGIAQRYLPTDELQVVTNRGNARILTALVRVGVPTGYRGIGPGYTTADIDVAHRFSPMFEGTLQVLNATNFYQNDQSAEFATVGRQGRVGLRVKL